MKFKHGDVVEVATAYFDGKHVTRTWRRATVTYVTEFAVHVLDETQLNFPLPLTANWIRPID